MTSKTSKVRIVSITPSDSSNYPSMLDVTWTVSPPPSDGTLTYHAAAPCTRGASFGGSCLPFANETQALQGSASKGRAVAAVDGTYSAKIALPNAYYAGLGTQYIPPALQVTYVVGNDTYKGAAKVADGVPFRTLTYPSLRTGPEFYAPQISDVVLSQQAILYASAFPSSNPIGIDGSGKHTAAAATNARAFWWPSGSSSSGSSTK